METNDFVDVTVKDGICSVKDNGAFSPIKASVNGEVCSVYVLAPNGKPIATLKVINKDTGEEIPVNISTCTDAVVCPEGKTTQHHLEVLYSHANDGNVHLTGLEKAALETKAGAQQKAITAKNEAVAAASLLVTAAKNEAAIDATEKANAARGAAYRYTDDEAKRRVAHEENSGNPHKVTAAQVGLGNVPNKATNDLQPTYTKADILSDLTSGERLAVAFGKIAKAISSLISHIANKSNPHSVTASQAGAVPNTGGTMTGTLIMDGGHIVLKEGINYGTDLPDPGIKGRVFFKVVE